MINYSALYCLLYVSMFLFALNIVEVLYKIIGLIIAGLFFKTELYHLILGSSNQVYSVPVYSPGVFQFGHRGRPGLQPLRRREAAHYYRDKPYRVVRHS